MIRFQHTEYLLGLIAIPVVVLLFMQVLLWKKKAAKKIGDEKLVASITNNYSSFHYLLKFLFITSALAGIITAVANMQKPGAMEDVKRKGVDVVIAMDVSKSMLAEDIKPNRLERARQMVYKLMDELPDDRVGLVLFAGRAYMQMPLTTDHGAARMYIQQAGPDAVPTQGTVIAEALKMANAAFNSKERKFKSIILITDGEDHDPEATKIAKLLADDGVMISTIGIGSAQGAPIIDPLTNQFKKDEAGNTVISKLNEPELIQLASTTRGVYVHLDDPDAAVRSVMNQLGSIEKTSLDDNAFKDYKNYFQWFLAAALLLLIVEFFFPERKWKTATT